MKKLFLILTLLLFTFSLIGQETIEVEGKELIIPESYSKLKDSYIEMAGMYLEAEKDLDRTLSNNEELQNQNKKLHSIVNKLQGKIEELVSKNKELISGQETLSDNIKLLTEEVDKWVNKKEPLFSLNLSTLYSTDIVEGTNKVGVGLGVDIKDFNVNAYWKPLSEITITFGYKVY